jgi:hypothetical protein
LSEAPGFRDIQTNGDASAASSTADDGTYRIAVLPGRGLLVAETGGSIYPELDPEVVEMPDPMTYIPPIYTRGQAFAEIDVAPGAPPLTRDFKLDPGRTLTGALIDPDGKPIAGARAYGEFTIGGWSWPHASEHFTVYGLMPPRPKTVGRLLKVRNVESLAALVMPENPRALVFQHKGRRLAGFIDVASSAEGPLQVRLQPWAVVSGRLVGTDGRPRAGIAFLPEIMGKARLGGGKIGHWPYRITTDREGRFRVEAIVPGLRYRLTLENASGVSTDTGPIVTPLKPGETRDLGDVAAIIPGEPN